MTPALEVEGLRVDYPTGPGLLSTDFSVAPGEVFGLIGETGSGKSSTALAIARLLPADARSSGRIVIGGVEVDAMSARTFRAIRATTVGFVPQDALAALNPVLTIGRQLAEIFEVHRRASRRDARARAVAALDRVWIEHSDAVCRLYPHQLSGGMRQRVMIAMAIALEPPLLIADEATTALDVTTQAEILRLVAHLRSEVGTSVLWITHDMGVIAELADRVGVMYAGRIVEQATANELYDAPRHPYTAELLRTLESLRAGAPGQRLFQIAGQPPATATTVSGCPFHPRCRHPAGECAAVAPDLVVDVDERRIACHAPLRVRPATPRRP